MPVPLLSFFTGGGFLDIGFEQAGFEVVWTNEINTAFAEMHNHGMKSWLNSFDGVQRDATISNRNSITDLRSNEVMAEAFGAHLPPIFGIIGGPPCTDFSVAGRNGGAEGEHGKLTQVFVDLVCSIRPDFFVMENVPGLSRTKKHRRFFASIVEQLEHPSVGYLTGQRILSSLEFGVPQDRDRLFVVGISSSLVENAIGVSPIPGDESWFPWPMPTFPGAKKLPWPSESPFGDEPSYPERVPLELTVYPLLCGPPAPTSLSNGLEAFNPYSPKFWKIPEGDSSGKSFKRLHRYKYSPTAWYGNNEVHLHPWEPRRLSVREALRIQTVPDTYVLPSEFSLSAKFKMICNGVPCRLARCLAEALSNFIGCTSASNSKASHLRKEPLDQRFKYSRPDSELVC